MDKAIFDIQYLKQWVLMVLKHKHDGWKKFKNKKPIIKLGMLVLSMVLIISNSSAANIALSSEIVFPGQTFDLNVSIDPLGKPITGAQLDFTFNRSLLRINSVKEGNFFQQKKAQTFFNNGSINNSSGKVVNIFDVIIGKTNVSTPGTFIIINITAIGSSGVSGINLSNVKVSDPNGSSVSLNVINANIRIGGGITVISPNGGEDWERGTTKTISWTSSGSPGTYVKIELLKSGVASILNSSTQNDGSYNVAIPSTQPAGTDYRVRITSTSNPAYTDTSNNNFIISTGITVISPNGGEDWARGTTKTISWRHRQAVLEHMLRS